MKRLTVSLAVIGLYCMIAQFVPSRALAAGNGVIIKVAGARQVTEPPAPAQQEPNSLPGSASEPAPPSEPGNQNAPESPPDPAAESGSDSAQTSEAPPPPDATAEPPAAEPGAQQPEPPPPPEPGEADTRQLQPNTAVPARPAPERVAPMPPAGEPLAPHHGYDPNHGAGYGDGFWSDLGMGSPHGWRRRPTCGHSCDDGCPPSWYVEGGVLFFSRDRDNAVRILEDQNGAGRRGERPTLLTSDAFDEDNADGAYLTIGRFCGPCHRIELTYMGVFEYQDTINVRSTTTPFNLSFPFDAEIDSNFDGFERLRATYDANLHSIESNLFYTPCGCCLSPFVGFRYLRLDEHLGLRAVEANGDIGRYLVDTDNDLVGFQIGALVERPIGSCWSWNFTGKAGGYVNFAHQNTHLTALDNSIVYRDFGNGEEDFAFVGELGINLVGHVTPRVAVTAGYHLLWLNGLALAPEQLDFSTTAGSGSHLDDDGDVLYFGVNIGVRVLF